MLKHKLLKKCLCGLLCCGILVGCGTDGNSGSGSISGEGSSGNGSAVSESPANEDVSDDSTDSSGDSTGSSDNSTSYSPSASDITVTDEILDTAIVNAGNVSRVYDVLSRAAAGEPVTLAYIGGSITDGSNASPQSTSCYAYLTTRWWEDNFPESDISYVNAGIGGTDSYLGIHRLEEDILEASPDLVVVEFAVNDSSSWNKESYESILRTVLAQDNSPAVVALMLTTESGYDYSADQMAAAFNNKVPIVSYSAVLADGLVSWSDVGDTDGVHPKNAGHSFIAALLTGFYCRVLEQNPDYDYSEYQLSASGMTKCRYVNSTVLYSDAITPEMTGFKADTVPGFLSNTNGWTTDEAGTITFTVEASEVGIAYLVPGTDDGSYASYEVLLDGVSMTTIGYTESWGTRLEYALLTCTDEVAEHTVTLVPTEDNTGTEFTILGLLVSSYE